MYFADVDINYLIDYVKIMEKLPRPVCSICHAPYYEDMSNDPTRYTYYRLDKKQTSKTHYHKSSISVDLLNTYAIQAREVISREEWKQNTVLHSERLKLIVGIKNRYFTVADELENCIANLMGKSPIGFGIIRTELNEVIGEPSAVSGISIGPDTSDIHGEILLSFHFYCGITVYCSLPQKIGSKFRPQWNKRS